MSNRGVTNLFRGVSRPAVLAKLTELAPTLPPFEPTSCDEARHVEWRIDVAASDTVAVVGQPLYSSGVPLLIETCAAAFACPWLVVRQQEGDHWDYSLYQGSTHLHTFSTFPQYWNSDPRDAKDRMGDPRQLASVWGVPVEDIAPYLRNWGERPNGRLARRPVLRGKARPDDEFEYGDMWQLLDFLRVLGAPRLDKPEHWQSVTVRVPDLVYVPPTLRGTSGVTKDAPN